MPPMARTADHQARRDQIAGAVSVLVGEHGLDAVTVAKVAARAEISVGLVQHYFPSKDDLLLFAHRRSMDAINHRIAAQLAREHPERLPIRQLLETGLTELMPLDGQRTVEYQVAQGFMGRCVDNPRLAEVARETMRDRGSRVAQAVTNGKECGEVAEDVDAEAAAIRILALVAGLAEQIFLDGDTRHGRRTVTSIAGSELRDAIAVVFTGRCRQYR